MTSPQMCHNNDIIDIKEIVTVGKVSAVIYNYLPRKASSVPIAGTVINEGPARGALVHFKLPFELRK